MTKLSEHHAGKIVKLLYLGDSGTGKTGSLVSLVNAGYKLRILDLDNGIDILKFYVKDQCPDKIDNVDYETRRDKLKASNIGIVADGVPKTYVQSLDLMSKWSDGTSPADWGPDSIFVLDSLTGFGRAAFNWARSINPAAKEPRTWYFAAQQACEAMLALMTSDGFKSNVIVIAHVQFQEGTDGTTRGYANSIGKAIGPVIPTYFNTMILARSSGAGRNVKRSINTVPTSMIDLKNPAPFLVDEVLPLETGLATLFTKLKEIN